ncbi:MAG: hypothetical protein BWK73_04595 [Thiothrix lacustris]|uniref:Uncharacterized protein n=1 Tax=Thiothrix lacustris TaxID=525917 RepID=A0A1Y1QXH3_9GAMM|nr:MAG: hypothetical protein BWK73_04595 [Thiothrix lacustris]
MKTREEVIGELQAIVQTDRHQWKVFAFERAIDAALTAFNRDRPLVATADCELRAGRSSYAADDCLIRYLGSDWGCIENIQPYDPRFPGALPRVHTVRKTSGMALAFTPAPTHKHIAAYGSHYDYWYAVSHVLTADDCSIANNDYDLFITRALASLMRDLIAANVTDPIQLHRGMGSLPNSATPLAAYEALMSSYQAGCL